MTTPYDSARLQAESIRAVLSPFMIRCEIAGSVRRKATQCGDIEIVAIRNPTMWFELARFIEGWSIVKGNAGGKYMQFGHTPHTTMAVDLFFATVENWPIIYTIRTGCAEFVCPHQGRLIE